MPYVKNNINEDFFELINTEDKAYWLGFLYADGYVTNYIEKCREYRYRRYRISLQLAIIDKEHLEKFRDIISPGAKLTSHGTYRNNNGVRLTINSKKMYDDLYNKGCKPLKTYNLDFPTIKQVPEELVNHFIRGYFDGDGSLFYTNTFQSNRNIIYKHPKISICGTLTFIKTLASILNIENKISSHRNTNYISTSTQSKVIRILKYMYANSTIALARKQRRAYKVLETSII